MPVLGGRDKMELSKRNWFLVVPKIQAFKTKEKVNIIATN